VLDTVGWGGQATAAEYSYSNNNHVESEMVHCAAGSTEHFKGLLMEWDDSIPLWQGKTHANKGFE
jgi:hypothetical protein